MIEDFGLGQGDCSVVDCSCGRGVAPRSTVVFQVGDGRLVLTEKKKMEKISNVIDQKTEAHNGLDKK